MIDAIAGSHAAVWCYYGSNEHKHAAYYAQHPGSRPRAAAAASAAAATATAPIRTTAAVAAAANSSMNPERRANMRAPAAATAAATTPSRGDAMAIATQHAADRIAAAAAIAGTTAAATAAAVAAVAAVAPVPTTATAAGLATDETKSTAAQGRKIHIHGQRVPVASPTANAAVLVAKSSEGKRGAVANGSGGDSGSGETKDETGTSTSSDSAHSDSEAAGTASGDGSSDGAVEVATESSAPSAMPVPRATAFVKSATSNSESKAPLPSPPVDDKSSSSSGSSSNDSTASAVITEESKAPLAVAPAAAAKVEAAPASPTKKKKKSKSKKKKQQQHERAPFLEHFETGSDHDSDDGATGDQSRRQLIYSETPYAERENRPGLVASKRSRYQPPAANNPIRAPLLISVGYSGQRWEQQRLKHEQWRMADEHAPEEDEWISRYCIVENYVLQQVLQREGLQFMPKLYKSASSGTYLDIVLPADYVYDRRYNHAQYSFEKWSLLYPDWLGCGPWEQQLRYAAAMPDDSKARAGIDRSAGGDGSGAAIIRQLSILDAARVNGTFSSGMSCLDFVCEHIKTANSNNTNTNTSTSISSGSTPAVAAAVAVVMTRRRKTASFCTRTPYNQRIL